MTDTTSEPVTVDRAEILTVLEPLFDRLGLNLNAAKSTYFDTWGVTIELVYSAKPEDRIPAAVHITDHAGMDVSNPTYTVTVPYKDTTLVPCPEEHKGVRCTGLAGHVASHVFKTGGRA